MNVSANESAYLSNIRNAAGVITEIVDAYDCSDKGESLCGLEDRIAEIRKWLYLLQNEIERNAETDEE